MGNYDFTLDLDSINTMSVINQWIMPETEVLEFGPANGRLTRYLSQEKKCRMSIVEIDEESGTEAAQYAVESYLGPEKGNIEKYYWKDTDRRFDYILFTDVLEHLSDPQKVIEACKEILKPDGRILVSVPNVTHNSILIDMINDKFEYDKVGLLDHSHIHFFSHKSFVGMMKRANVFITEMVPIYSRVGENEIKNNYHDVPVEIEKFLRKRAEGSVYQYVYNLALDEKKQVEIPVQIFELDEYEELEAQCFYRNETEEYSAEKRVRKCFRENESVEWVISTEMLAEEQIVRLDPMEYTGIIQMEKAVFETEDGEQDLVKLQSNAIEDDQQLLIFDTPDPWIEYQLPEKYKEGKIHFKFRILDYGRNAKWYEKFVFIMDELGIQMKAKDGKSLREDPVKEMEAVIEEQKGYIAHLEHDIQEQKEYVDHLERDIAELKAYIEQKNM